MNFSLSMVGETISLGDMVSPWGFDGYEAGVISTGGGKGEDPYCCGWRAPYAGASENGTYC